MSDRYGYRLPTDLEMEQADEIGRLRAEVTSLTAQCESYRESFAGTVKVNDNLRAENAKLREAAMWRPVDTAPDDGSTVIVTDGYSVQACHLEDYPRRWSGGRHAFTGKITHWMPLPEPPK